MANIGELIGRNIKELRDDLGISQAELGKRVGLTVQAINRIEVGERQPRRSNLLEIAKALKCSAATLYQDKSLQPRPNYADAVLLLESYGSAKQPLQGVAMTILTLDAQHSPPDLSPPARKALEALIQALKASR